MQRLPSRRYIRWPLWLGVLAGAGACWASLLYSPLLHAAWRDWADGELSAPTLMLLLAVAGMSLLALWWGVAEADDH